MSSQKTNNLTKNNYRRNQVGGQPLSQSSSQEQKDILESNQRFSQDIIDSQRDDSFPIISFVETQQQVNPRNESVQNKEEYQITTPKKNIINPSSFSEAINSQQSASQQQNNKSFMQKNLLSPTSSQSSSRSRNSLSSPIQIRINPNQFPQQMGLTRKSLNYEISQIQEKRLEDEKSAISYAEKVLMNRNFLSQQKSKQENQRHSLFLASAQQAGVISKEGQQQGILKKKLPFNNNLTVNNQVNNNNNILGNQNIPVFNSALSNKNNNNNESNYNSNIISLNNNVIAYNQQILNDQIKLNNPFQSQSNVQSQQNYYEQPKSWSSQELPDDPQKPVNNIKISNFQLPDRSDLNTKIHGSDINQFATSNNKISVNNTVSQASSKVRGRRTLGQNQNIDLNNGREVATLDRKTLDKITKKNTERNSIIQPERSMEDHCNKLARCNEHSKRIKELYCVDESCQIKQKFGCVLCFSSVNGSPHSFHEYYTISSEEDLQQKINRNREEFISFITHQINQKSEAINSVIRRHKTEITNSLINYASALQDRLFIGFEAEEIKKFQLPLLQGRSENQSPNKKSKRQSRDKKDTYDEKELSIVLYLDLLAKQLDKKIENQTKIWLDQKYLGNKDEEFERQKRCKLIIISKCFSNLSEQQLQSFINAGDLVYNLLEYENNNPQLHYISDQHSDGIYQLDDNKDKQGRGIQFLKGGTIYEGYFKKNQRYGMGKLITSYGDIYVGEFKKNLQKGQGVLKYANNDIYTGEFKADQRHGQGTLYSASNQTKYVGAWARNQRQGKCQIYDRENNLIFTGSYENDQVKQ